MEEVVSSNLTRSTKTKPTGSTPTEEALRQQREPTPIAKLCQRNGIRKLGLFGSVLTDRFSESSDIDVLVEFQPDAHVGFFRLAEIEDELSRLWGGRRVDLRTPMDLSRHFREQVVRDALAVYAES